MWQRIQTLYLALATGLIVAMMFSLKAVVPGADGTFLQEVKYTAYTPYIILIIVIALLDFLALTTFRFREFQMRTAVLAAIITLALQAWIAVDYFTADSSLVFRITAVFPLAAIVCDLLAARGIASDIMVAESFNHLRIRKKNRK
ncbi:MAG: DUF4293 family protein [Bacteroidales bacterium]|nr:DUF4293 family protein [Bacteroidales bacterium]